MGSFAEDLGRVLTEYSYFAIFAALLLENTIFLGIFVPGVTVLLIAGFACAVGELSFVYCVIAGYLGTVAGDNVSFIVGRYGAERFRYVREYLKRNSNISSRIARLNVYALTFFHFPGLLRMTAPLILGATQFAWRKWLPIDLIGGLLFNLAFVGLGFAIGNWSGLYADAETIAFYLQIFFAIFFLIWLAILFRSYLAFRSKSRTVKVLTLT